MRSPGIQESWSLNYKTVMGLTLISAVLILCIVMFYRRRLAKNIEKQQKEVKLEEEMNRYRELDSREDFIRSLKHVETFIGEVFGDGRLPETIKLSDALELVDLFGLYLQRNNLLKIENTEKNEIMQETLNENIIQVSPQKPYENKVEPPSEVPNVKLQLEIQKPCLDNPKQVVPQNLKSKVEPPFKAPSVHKKKADDTNLNTLPLEIEKPISGNKKQVLPLKLKSSVAPPSKPRELKIEKPSCLSTKVLPQKLKSSVAPPSKPRELKIEKPSCLGKKVFPKKLMSSVAPPSKPRNVSKTKTEDKNSNEKSPMEVE